MARSVRRAISRARPFLRAVACGICFGLVGLIWSAPRFRRRRLRRAATCGVCASHMRVRNVAVLVVAVLLVAGAAARPLEAATSPLLCHSHITADGSVRPEPRLRIAPPTPWQVTRDFLVAPISGVGVLAGRAMGMEPCSAPPLLVMFRPPPRTSSGGTTLGDVFVAWMPGEPTSGPATVNGYGNEGHRLYMRYGPNISPSREDEEELGRHESRHVDQWAVANLVAGPFAFPTAYFIDNSLFPRSRNHFERDAGLAGGHYPPAPDNLPAPRWPDTLIVMALGLLIFRRRLRWMLRVLQDPSSQLSAHAPGRCPVHSKGLRPIERGTA